MYRNRKLLFALSLVVALLPLPAWSQGLYVGVGFGHGSSDAPGTENVTAARDAALTFVPASSNTAQESSGDIGKLLVGFRLSKYLAVEATYSALHHLAARATAVSAPTNNTDGTVTTSTFTATEDFAPDVLVASVIGSVPVASAASVFARVGVVRWHAEAALFTQQRDETFDPTTEETTVTVTRNTVSSASERGTDSVLGAGIDFGAGPVRFRLEFERYKDIGGAAVGGSRDFDVASATVLFIF